MDRYVCYYCQKAYEDYPELIKHLCFQHANDIVKYRERERELDSASGRLGYRTKYFQDIIPSKCEISVTRDNRLSISNVDRSKKTKTNTSERTNDSINYNGNDGQTSRKSLSDMLEEMDITQENDDLDSDDMHYLVRKVT
jgi:hypothetical protein